MRAQQTVQKQFKSFRNPELALKLKGRSLATYNKKFKENRDKMNKAEKALEKHMNDWQRRESDAGEFATN